MKPIHFASAVYGVCVCRSAGVVWLPGVGGMWPLAATLPGRRRCCVGRRPAAVVRPYTAGPGGPVGSAGRGVPSRPGMSGSRPALGATCVRPALSTLLPNLRSAPLTRAEAPLTRAEAPLTRAEAPLTRAEAPLTRAEAPLTRAEAPLTRAELAPWRVGRPARSQRQPPRRRMPCRAITNCGGTRSVSSATRPGGARGGGFTGPSPCARA